MDLRQRIIEVTDEIFTTMVMMETQASGEQPEPVDHLSSSITGMIGLAGGVKGNLAVHFPYGVACAVTGAFLGMEVEEVNEDVEDAIGEVANMLGGSIKAMLSENGRDIELSLPSTISGKEYDLQCSKNVDREIIKFSTGSGDFIVDLQLES